jgi:hypothetical protein
MIIKNDRILPMTAPMSNNVSSLYSAFLQWGEVNLTREEFFDFLSTPSESRARFLKSQNQNLIKTATMIKNIY